MLSENGLKALKQRLLANEGYRRFLYKDSLGVQTIGIGRNIDRKGIALDEAFDLLCNDISEADHDCDRSFPFYANLDEVRKTVVCEMCFQLGLEGLEEFKNMLLFISKGLYDDAANEMMKSTWARQTPQRAFRLSELMRKGSI